uniref:Uncharacterized protein n=1 Tax=Cucumis melo TaxID=3656 RepID=A0A9I9EG56_CUCME
MATARNVQTHLYPPVILCKKTNIVNLAMLIPRQVLGPDPKVAEVVLWSMIGFSLLATLYLSPYLPTTPSFIL